MKPVVTFKKQLRKEVFDRITEKGMFDNINEQILGEMRKQIVALGPPPLGCRYEVSEPRYDFIPEEGKYTITSYIKTVPIEQ